MSYAGFDRADCPDLAMMARLKAETNLVWCGYYLRAPSQAASTWRGKRAALVKQGWGLAPIFVGQETVGPGSHVVTAAQGVIDGKLCVSDMLEEGFPSASAVFIDLENGPPFGSMEKAYVGSLMDAINSSGFRAGVYCSFLFAAQVAALRPSADLWVFHVNTVNRHAVSGKNFPAPDPSASRYKGAKIWQHDDSAVLTAFGNLLVDLDSAVMPDPGAPGQTVAPVVTTSDTERAGVPTAAGARVGEPRSAAVIGNTNMNFAAILAMIESAVSLLPTVETATTTAIADVKGLLVNPAVQQLEGAFSSLLHIGSTPTATVLSPKAAAQ